MLKDAFSKLWSSSWRLRNSRPTDRTRRLMALRHAIVAHQADILTALAGDLGKNGQMAGAEIAAVLADIDEAAASLEGWMAPVAVEPRRFPTASATVRTEAKGVVAIFGAWNFPFNLLFQPLVPALAAGNAILLKANELAPETSAVAAAIIREVFDPAEVLLLEGGVETANEILKLPLDHIFFTGSPVVGRIVMAAAARNLTSVTLELGGKNPVIIDESAELARAAREIVAARCINSGQLCLAPDHIWVARNVYEDFVGHAVDAMRALFYPGGNLNVALLGRFVNQSNLDRVARHIADAERRGGRMLIGGGVDRARLTIDPGILVDVPPDATIMQEEIFGPILPILPFDTEDVILNHVRPLGKPLALYIYSTDVEASDRWTSAIPSGGVTVNGVVNHAMENALPFGGVGTSGMGRYHGHHGFLEFSHQRSVLQMGVS